jgi:outer membrane lipoprotein SlyB
MNKKGFCNRKEVGWRTTALFGYSRSCTVALILLSMLNSACDSVRNWTEKNSIQSSVVDAYSTTRLKQARERFRSIATKFNYKYAFLGTVIGTVIGAGIGAATKGESGAALGGAIGAAAGLALGGFYGEALEKRYNNANEGVNSLASGAEKDAYLFDELAIHSKVIAEEQQLRLSKLADLFHRGAIDENSLRIQIADLRSDVESINEIVEQNTRTLASIEYQAIKYRSEGVSIDPLIKQQANIEQSRLELIKSLDNLKVSLAVLPETVRPAIG